MYILGVITSGVYFSAPLVLLVKRFFDCVLLCLCIDLNEGHQRVLGIDDLLCKVIVVRQKTYMCTYIIECCATLARERSATTSACGPYKSTNIFGTIGSLSSHCSW